MVLKEGKLLLVIRFSDPKTIDTIVEHQKILNAKGEVWFGKIGKSPSKNFMNSQLNENDFNILLVNKNDYYIASCKDISFDSPENYPQYYNTYLSTVNFGVWFKLTMIEKIPYNSTIDSMVVDSSGNYLRDALKQSMNSMMKARLIKEVDSLK